MEKKEWFANWFNSPLYHTLYKNRDFNEAKLFIDNLLAYLKPTPENYILDLACGKGRHAYHIAQHGIRVLGLDLSPKSIQEAKKMYHPLLTFDIHDMRKAYQKNTFDYIFNLFTSFGYFEKEEDNIRTLQSISAMLRPKGILVIDFMNTHKVGEQLIRKEQKKIDGIFFDIERKIEHGYIKKIIRVEGYTFEEKVQQINLETFKRYFTLSGLTLNTTFGDYALTPFDIKHSDRLILIAQKHT